MVEVRAGGKARHLVAGETQVAEDELVLGEAGLNDSLQPAVVLHPVGERVADNANVIARLEFQLRRVGVEWSSPRREEGKGANDRDGHSMQHGGMLVESVGRTPTHRG